LFSHRREREEERNTMEGRSGKVCFTYRSKEDATRDATKKREKEGGGRNAGKREAVGGRELARGGDGGRSKRAVLHPRR